MSPCEGLIRERFLLGFDLLDDLLSNHVAACSERYSSDKSDSEAAGFCDLHLGFVRTGQLVNAAGHGHEKVFDRQGIILSLGVSL